MLTLKVAYEYVVPDHGAKWRAIGTLLGLSPGQLDMIDHDCHHRAAECSNAVLSKWLDTDTGASLEKLKGVIKLLSKPESK